MNEQAAHLVDRVLPHVPYRQWVLTLPRELARVVAFDAELATAVFGVFADEPRSSNTSRLAPDVTLTAPARCENTPGSDDTLGGRPRCGLSCFTLRPI